jgi:hypothetical protein
MKYAAILLLLSAGEVLAQGLTATIESVKGEVAVRQGSAAWQPITAGRALATQDEVFTGVDSEATIRFSDGSAMSLRELTQVLIGTLLKGGGKKQADIQLRVGEIKAQVTKEKAVDTDFSIRTATATASVRGTEINEVSFHPARGMFTDLKTGALLVTSRRGSTMTRPNDRARVDPGGRLQPPHELQRMNGQVRVEPVGLTRREQQQIHQGPQPRPFVQRGTPDPSHPEGNGPIVGRPRPTVTLQ